jgi:hypothetical protein
MFVGNVLESVYLEDRKSGAKIILRWISGRYVVRMGSVGTGSEFLQ